MERVQECNHKVVNNVILYLYVLLSSEEKKSSVTQLDLLGWCWINTLLSEN